jgi:glucose-1-phosphate thymidylyltransferase
VCCPEEIAFRSGWIGRDELAAVVAGLGKTSYASYLLSLLQEGV